MNDIKNRIFSPEAGFVLCAIIFGILLIVLTPPLQSADEQYHFTRAYSVAKGQILSKKSENLMGNYLPEAFREFGNRYFYLFTSKNTHTSPKEIKESAKIKIDTDKKFFCNQSHMALYSPAAYFPQAAGIAVADLFTDSVYWLLISAKAFLLIFYIFVGYFTVRALPFLKEIAVLMLLMPMSLSLGASVSADGVLIAISALYFAKILQYSYAKETISRKQFFFLMFLALMLALIKQSFLISLFVLFIPKEKYIGLFKNSNLQSYYAKMGILLLPGFLASIIWSKLIMGIYVPIHGANPDLQISFILHHPIEYLKSLLLTFNVYFRLVIFSMVGILGWLDVIFRPQVYCAYISILLLNVIFAPKTSERVSSTFFQKSFLLLFFMLNIFVISTIIYITWVAPGDTGIWSGLQGRYFIPVLLPFYAFLYLLYCKFFKPIKAVWIIPINSLLLAFTYFNVAIAMFFRYF